MPEKKPSWSLPPQNLPTIDLTPNLRLDYVAEGAANILYRIVLPPPSPSTSADQDIDLGIDISSPALASTSSHDGPSSSSATAAVDIQHSVTEIAPLRMDPRFEGKLVRLRKATKTSVPVLDSHKFFKRMIAPGFAKGELVEQVLFRPTPALLRDCNARLHRMEEEDTRPDKRHGVYLDEKECHGSLVTDMTRPPEGMWRCVEFKPKWLVQSPSAPVGSRRCRTCALRAMKGRGLQRSAQGSGEKGGAVEFCPLNLVSLDRGRVAVAVNEILGPVPRFRKHGSEFLSQFRGPGEGDAMNGDLSEGVMRDRIADFLHGNPLLEALRRKQVDLDPVGVFKADLISLDFLAAMSLRDCTLFLKVRIYSRCPWELTSLEA